MRSERCRVRQPVDCSLVKQAIAFALGACLLVSGGRSVAGHQVGHFPSYYPDEIRIDIADPAAAGKALVEQSLHAYVGAVPSFTAPVPAHVRSVKSLSAFLTLSFNPASTRFASADARCAAGRAILAALRDETSAGYIFHPYPITPYHADYLHHLDLVEAAKEAVLSARSSQASMKVGARGMIAEAIVRAHWGVAADADIILETTSVSDLLATSDVRFNGWTEPPWLKEGWFQAHRLLAPGLPPAQRSAADEDHERLIRGDVRDLAQHSDLERQLIATLTGDCHRMVAGYAEKEEYFNSAYPDGVENIAHDSLGGLNAPIFLRTVKLKEYPWNGKLQLAVGERPDAAWNPVAGFTDAMGRLIWSAVGDPAMLAIPFNASWMPNRVQSEVSRIEGQSGGIRVPADALRPQAGTGALTAAGERTFSSVKVVYEVLASPFEDGTELTMVDLLYPFAFAYRWGAGAAGGNNVYEPRLKEVFGVLQDRLVAIQPLQVDRTTHAVAEGMNVTWKTAVLEVYLRNVPGDERQVAALAPPWSTLPWHLLALMEEAVVRGYAAFSREEAARRRVPWLDLVRDATLREKLLYLVGQFVREAYRPEALKRFVSEEEAQARWRSLRAFAQKKGHFLVSNGPYRLKHWQPPSVVLEAVREMSYPLGFGTFDRFVNPPKAQIETVTQDGGEVTVRASVAMALKGGREYHIVKEPLTRTTSRGVHGLLVVSRYLLIGPDGKVLKLDKMQWGEDGAFTIKLPDRLPPGQYKVVLAVFLDGNSLQPSTRILQFRVGASGPPG
jgi:hypothetical protein